MLKLALLGMMGGFLLAAPGEVFSSSISTHSMMATLSPACRSGGCGHRGSHAAYNNQDPKPEATAPMVENNGEDNTVVDPKQFYTQLDSESRKLYDGLSEEGKQLAIRLSKQYVNKNQAVKEAVNTMQAQKPPEKN